ncbi:thermonuclease family protein [Hutsoniella sourekii]
MITIIIVVLIAIFAPEWLETDYQGDIVTQDEWSQVSYDFNGSNYEVLPRHMRLPVELERVKDGDTIQVDLAGYIVDVRYLIIDTPELRTGTSKRKQLGQVAKERNRELLESANQIYLELDRGPATDKYQRLLAYVYSDDLMINEALVRQGLAEVRYVYPPNNSYENLLRKSQEAAQADRVNLWR